MNLFDTFFNSGMLGFYSFLLAIVLFFTLLLTMQQNQKILEASVRPYLAISVERNPAIDETACLVIKNYGRTAGRITRFQYSDSWKNVPQIDKVRTLTLAPGQAIRLPYHSAELQTHSGQIILSYSASTIGKNYTDQFELSL